MSIATRTGDQGQTSLLFGRRVSKTHPRIEANGTLDELTCALGLARAQAREDFLRDQLLAVQRTLWIISGELAVDDADREKFLKSQFSPLQEEHLQFLDHLVAEYESRATKFQGFVQPGDTIPSAFLHWARATARRAERTVWRAVEAGHSINPLVLRYLNRLSDVLWLMAREDEVWNAK